MSRKKILFCANIHQHFRGFHLPVFQWFQEQGWEVHAAAGGEADLPYTDRVFDIGIRRSPFHAGNWKAYRQLRKLIKEENYDIVHGHTPMGGVLARTAARAARRQGTKVMYTAHGFHFCKGAPLLNWLAYYPIEKALSSITDCLITINHEDYTLAVDRKFRAGRISHVHGAGVNTERYQPASPPRKEELRHRFGYGEEEFLMVYAAEFNGNKNQQLLLQAMVHVKEKHPEAKLLLAGEGPLLLACRELAARLNVADRVEFLGYRKDIADLLQMSDAAVGASFREGLPVNIMEAMACGLPVIASDNRGHCELIADGVNGFIVPPDDARMFAARILQVSRSQELRDRMAVENVRRVKEKYSLEQVKAELSDLYKSYMEAADETTESQYHHAYL
ncbi:glycosyltransferase family 4 protein [Paenibacillus gansuensis]|uniref:Glycosyltransferase family 4 protein n=1 Tax=Paenibacillus gansuensis TaxID=306542 RepID=A0ABW5PHY4_9BACL